MSLRRLLHLAPTFPPKNLHDAIERAANRQNLQSGEWYRVKETYVFKLNPITEYRVELEQNSTPEPQLPPQ